MMRVADLRCPKCDGRVADVAGDFTLYMGPSVEGDQVLWCTCDHGHPLRVSWSETPCRLAVEVQRG